MKTFTDVEVNAISARNRRQWESERKQLETDHATALNSAMARATELERQVSVLTRERDGLVTKVAEIDTERTAHRAFRVDLQMTEALKGARVLSSASKHALKLFLESSELEHDESGAVAAVKYGGERYEDAQAAAGAFLKDNNFLAAEPRGGGGGTRPPSAGGAGRPKVDVTTLRPEDLIEAGWKKGQP